MLIHICFCVLTLLGMSGLVFGLNLSPWFFFALPLLYAAIAASYLLILLFIYLFLPKKPRGRSIPFCRAVLFRTLRWFLILFHTEVVIEGEALLPKEPFVMISNHRSNLDPIVTFAAFPHRKLSFVSKMENMKIPVAGPFIANSGFLGIERTKPKQSIRVIEQAADMVKDEGFDFGDDDSIIYEVKCACGNVIAFDEETLEKGSIICEDCGELLEFTFDDEDEE